MAIQLEQPDAEVVPGFSAVPRKPEAQMVQEETDTLPLMDEEIPVGQDVQLDAPALEYEPEGQTVQPAEFTVPEFITIPA